MTPPRVVFDTNVVLSALVFQDGVLARLRRLWSEGACIPLASPETGSELVRALAYPKFRLAAEERERLLFEYLPFCEDVAMPRRLPRLPPCRDPNDHIFLRLAVVGGADALVTGDGALLTLAGRIPTLILKPAAFLRQIETQTSNLP
ncbi:MAG: putative toxin-antitoxin system toxin component, PIN family [Vulcanimicrobiaceae bacterium]